MDTARQIIRWSIPGWCFFIWFMVFIGIRYVLLAVLSGNVESLSLSVWLASHNKLLDPSLGIVLGAAGIPLGYIGYQFYFWLYWRAIRIPNGPMIVFQIDKGSRVLEGVTLTPEESTTGFALDLERVPESQIWHLKRWPLRDLIPTLRYIPKSDLNDSGVEISSYEIQQRMQRNWVRTLALWYKFVASSSTTLDRQVSFMFDIYHSQGAARTALLPAFLLDFVYDWLLHYLKMLSPGNINLFALTEVMFINLSNLLVLLILYRIMSTIRHNLLNQIILLMNRLVGLRNVDDKSLSIRRPAP